MHVLTEGLMSEPMTRAFECRCSEGNVLTLRAHCVCAERSATAHAHAR